MSSQELLATVRYSADDRSNTGNSLKNFLFGRNFLLLLPYYHYTYELFLMEHNVELKHWGHG